jgi:alkanesulfonate monooxygenase SsuD/methylene tetrahydromethanopterin reductase-like flavin-dependent oxidoreductase (luciferase family)
MRIDLLFDPFDATWPAVAELAEAAESLGFDGLWTWDHLAGQVHGASSVLEAWTVLSALAARTSRVTIGPLVANVANRRPGVLAAMAATLQHVSAGRLVLGLGAGGGRDTPYWREQSALGADVPGDAERRRQLADAVAVCRQVWSGRTGPTELATTRLGPGSGFLRPDPAPPIVIGGFGPRVAELAGEVADGFNTQAGHPDLARLVSIAREAHQRAGRTGAFEISGFGGLDPAWVDAASGRLDRLVCIVSPADGVRPLARFATAVGLEPPGDGGGASPT